MGTNGVEMTGYAGGRGRGRRAAGFQGLERTGNETWDLCQPRDRNLD